MHIPATYPHHFIKGPCCLPAADGEEVGVLQFQFKQARLCRRDIHPNVVYPFTAQRGFLMTYTYEQNGFRKDRSCQDHISSLYYILENRKLSKLDTYCCFVDFKKAFDSIPRELQLLWQKLAKYGINGQILRCLQAAYTNVTSSIRIDKKLSNSFEINCGLKQGCPLSPTLFNIYINDLIDDLNQEDEGISFEDCKVNALLYADDVVLLGGSPD